MNKKIRLRAPLVVTVIAGAALSACGGAVVTPSAQCPSDPPAAGASCDPAAVRGGTCGYGVCQGRPLTQATCDAQTRVWTVSSLRCEVTPPTRACPAAQPSDGARCDASLDPASCNYGWSDCLRGPAVNVRCEGGAWRAAVSTCNPPAPACPPSAPATDDPCVGALSCNYGDCAGAPTTYARCESGRWQVAESSCNPPPPMTACPPTAPLPGAPCAIPNGGPVCTFGSCADGGSFPTALCLDGRWALQTVTCEPTPVPVCPGAPPEQGAACGRPSFAPPCTWGDCNGAPTTFGACVGGRWEVNIRSCETPLPTCASTPAPQGSYCPGFFGASCEYDPCVSNGVAATVCFENRIVHRVGTCAPRACPADAPVVGDPCTQPPSASCDYGRCGSLPALRYTCSAGRWSVARGMCGDYCPPSRPLAGSACSRDAVQPCRYPGAVCGGTQLQNEAACNPMTNRWVITEYVCR
jgi:hypothetical protein